MIYFSGDSWGKREEVVTKNKAENIDHKNRGHEKMHS